MGLGHPSPSLLSLSDRPWHWAAVLLGTGPLSAQPAFHCPATLLLIPVGSSMCSGPLAAHPSLATFCFLLVITPTPLGNYGEEIQATGVQRREKGTFLTSLVPQSLKARPELGCGKGLVLLAQGSLGHSIEKSPSDQMWPQASFVWILGLLEIRIQYFHLFLKHWRVY